MPIFGYISNIIAGFMAVSLLGLIAFWITPSLTRTGASILIFGAILYMLHRIGGAILCRFQVTDHHRRQSKIETKQIHRSMKQKRAHLAARTISDQIVGSNHK